MSDREIERRASKTAALAALLFVAGCMIIYTVAAAMAAFFIAC